MSCFDGISCGHLALDRAGIKIANYFASEIDKYAIKVTQYNYPYTVQLGDITKIKGKDLPKIDLLMGGSPCQSFSLSGTQLNFNDPRGKLFFEFVRLLKETSPKYFFLENVIMKQEYQKIISKYLQVSPIKINSALVSAQNRKRLYWTNILNISQPKNKYILLKDVWDGGINITERILKKKVGSLSYTKAWSSVRTLNDKSKCIMAGGQQISNSGATNVKIDNKYYAPNILTCERLQTIPDNYTNINNISNTQKYKMIGNGWTVDVVAHVFKGLKNPYNKQIKLF